MAIQRPIGLNALSMIFFIMSSKVSIRIYLPKDLAERLRRHIAEKNRTYTRGLLSETVQKAIENYLRVECVEHGA